MGVDLRSDNHRLTRAAWTAMDQTYGTVQPGFLLQPIDNSGRGFAQPWSTPEGFVVKSVFEDPRTNFKLTLYKNEATDEVLVVPLGTNGSSDWKGWSSNLRDMGLSQWSTARTANLEPISLVYLDALNELVNDKTIVVFAGDSKAAMQAQFMLNDFVKTRATLESDPYEIPVERQNLSRLSNDRIAIVARGGGAAEMMLKRDDPTFDPNGPQFAGIEVDYSAARFTNGLVELVSQLGGGMINGRGKIQYFDEGVGMLEGGTLTAIPYLHRLVVSGYDWATAVGGDFSRRVVSDRIEIDLGVLQSLGSFFGNIGVRDLPTDPEALMRFVTTAVCGIATAPPGAVFSAVYDFTAPAEGVIAALGKGVLAEVSRIGLAAPLLAACGIGVVGENAAAGVTGPVSSQLAGDLVLEWAVTTTGAPPLAEGVQRQFGRSGSGEMHVIDTGPDGTTFYTFQFGNHYVQRVDPQGNYQLNLGSITWDISPGAQSVIRVAGPDGGVTIKVDPADVRFDPTKKAALQIYGTEPGGGQSVTTIFPSGVWTKQIDVLDGSIEQYRGNFLDLAPETSVTIDDTSEGASQPLDTATLRAELIAGTHGLAATNKTLDTYDAPDRSADAAIAYAGSLQSALSLYGAIDAGNPLSIATSGLSFARSVGLLDEVRDLRLGFGALGAGLGLYGAIERGDAAGIVLSGGALIDALGDQAFSRAIGSAVGSALGLADGVAGGVMPGLGLVTSLVSGDPLGIASGALSLIGTMAAIPGLQIAAIVVGIVGAIFGGLFGDDEEEPPPPRPWGEGALHWDGAGALTFSAIGGDHNDQVEERYGREPVEKVLAGLVDYLNAHTPEGYGVIPGRLPLVHYEQLYDTFTLTLHDPVSGSPYTRSFHSTSGYAIDRPAGREALDTFHEVYLAEAERQRAIAPEFELDRILDAGLGTSSLQAVQSGAAFEATRSLVAEAGASGHAAAEDPLSPTRAFNPIAIGLTAGLAAELSLPHSLVPEGLDAPGLLFDLSRNGYVSLAEWAGASQALLAVDLDADGLITHGEEVFSDARVDGAYRGLNYLGRYDRDASGAIDAADPIYPALKLWLRVQNVEGTWEDVVVGLEAAGLAAIDLGEGTARWADTGRSDTGGSDTGRSEETVTAAATAALRAETAEHRYTPMEGAVHDEVRGKGETVYVREARALAAGERARLLGAGGALSAILAEQEGASLVRVPAAPLERWLVAFAAGATFAAGEALAAPDIASWTAEAPHVPPPGRAQDAPVLASIDWRGPEAAGSAPTAAPGATPGASVPLGAFPAWVADPVREGFVVLRGTSLPASIGEAVSLPASAEAPIFAGAPAIERVSLEHPYDPFAVRDLLPVATQHAINNTALRIRPESLVDLDDRVSGPLRVSAVGEAKHGTVQRLPDGTIVFTPEPGFAGEASFRFTVSSPGGTHREHAASVLVTRAEDETSYAMADRARAFDLATLTATDEDYSGSPLQVLALGNAAHGRVGFDPRGYAVFEPDPGFAGAAGFDYLVRDGWGNTTTNRHTLLLTRTVDETLRAVNDVARVYAQAELTAGDENYSGAPLTIAAIGATAHGTATIDDQGDADPANDRVTFLPDPGFAGFAHFAYTVRDQWGNEDENLATVGVSRIVDAPALHTMNRVGFDIAGTRLTGQNDDGSGAPFTLLGLASAAGGTASLDDGGDADPLSDRVTFTPAADFSGRGGFDFLARDHWGQEVLRHVEVTVTKAVDHLVHAMNNEIARYDPRLLVANDEDGTGEPLAVLSVGRAVHGTVGFDGAGKIAFAPDPGYSGAASFGYTVRDAWGNALETTAEVLVTRTQAQVAHTFGGAPVAFTDADLVRGFEDFSGQSLAITAISGVTGGALGREADGRLVFDLDSAHVGTFQFEVEDAWGQRGSETLTLYDSGAGDVLIGAPQTLVYAEHTFELSAQALAAQALPGGGSELVNFYFTDDGTLQPLPISAVKNASHAIISGSLGSLPDAAGVLTLAPGENLLLTPDRALANDRARYSGSEIGFDFEVASPHGAAATHHATLRVPYLPDTRIVETVANTPTRIDADELLKHASDFSGTPMRVVQVANGSHGMAVLDAKGTPEASDDEVVFTPEANYWSRLFDPATGRFHDMASRSGDAYAGPLRDEFDRMRDPASFAYTVEDAFGNRFERSALVGVNYRQSPQVSTSLGVDYANFGHWQSYGAHGELASHSPYPESALTYSGAFAYGHGPYSANDLRVDSGGSWQFTEQVFSPAKDPGWRGNWGFAESWMWVRDPAGNQSDLLALLFGGYGDDGAPNDRGPEAVGLPHGTVLEGDYGLTYIPGTGALGAMGNGAIARAAPVILDLDGDGVKLVPPQISTVYFDMAGDGVARRTGWADAGDGILTLDLNQDGEIVSLAEMAFTQYLAGARTDLEGLRAFDANADLVLDGTDPVWSALALWQDANQNGLTDAGELRSLGAEGVRSLSLVSDWNTREDPGGNLVHGETSFERADGSRGIAADVSLAYEAGAMVPRAPPAPPAPSGWVEPGPQLVLQIIADMATQLSPPGDALVSVVPEPIPIAPGMIEESPFG